MSKVSLRWPGPAGGHPTETLRAAPRFRGDPAKDTLAAFSVAHVSPVRGAPCGLASHPAVPRATAKGPRTRDTRRLLNNWVSVPRWFGDGSRRLIACRVLLWIDRELLDAESLVRHLVPAGSVFAFLADHRRELFPDGMFADLFPSATGRPSVPADVIASVIVLQTLHGLSDSGGGRCAALRSAVEGRLRAGVDR